MPTFKISEDGKSITCLVCGMTSYHPRDVSEGYCGNCHAFHVRRGQCIAFDENGKEVAWLVEDFPEFTMSKIRSM